MTKFSLTKDEVLALAGKSMVVEEALRKKFPEAFKPLPLPVAGDIAKVLVDGRPGGIEIRNCLDHSDRHHNRGFWLNPSYDWRLEENAEHTSLVLVAYPKGALKD